MCCHNIACVRWRCCDNVAIVSGLDPKPAKGSAGIVFIKALADSSEALQEGRAVYKYSHPGMHVAFIKQVLATQSLKTAYEELQKQTSRHEAVRKKLPEQREAYKLTKEQTQEAPSKSRSRKSPSTKERSPRKEVKKERSRSERSWTRSPNPSASSHNPPKPDRSRKAESPRPFKIIDTEGRRYEGRDRSVFRPSLSPTRFRRSEAFLCERESELVVEP